MVFRLSINNLIIVARVGESGVEDAEEVVDKMSPVHRPLSATSTSKAVLFVSHENGVVNNAFQKENGSDMVPLKPVSNGEPLDEGEEATVNFISE